MHKRAAKLPAPAVTPCVRVRAPDRAAACAIALAAALVVGGATLVTASARAQAAPPTPSAASRLAAKVKRGVGTRPNAAAPVSEWDEAVNAFKYQDMDTAVARLRKLIYPKSRLDRDREWRAREYLAAALWWSGKKQPALDEFTALLVRNPQARLDPAYYPPQMIKDFAQLRANLVRLGVIKKDQKPAAQKPNTLRQPPAAALMYFPFGVGQFANQQTLKGSLFLGSELALAGASVTLYMFNRDLGVKGQRNDSARVWQVSTGAVFWGVVAWGVIDAVVQRRAIAAEVARATRKLVR